MARAAPWGSPQGSTLLHDRWLYPEWVWRGSIRYASAMAWMLFAIVMACITLVLDQVIQPVGLLSRWLPVSGAAVATVAHGARRRTTEARRKSFLTAVANHSLARSACRRLRPAAFFVLTTSLMTQQQALTHDLDTAPLPVAELHRYLQRGAAPDTDGTRSSTPAWPPSVSCSPPFRSRTPFRSSSGADSAVFLLGDLHDDAAEPSQ